VTISFNRNEMIFWLLYFVLSTVWLLIRKPGKVGLKEYILLLPHFLVYWFVAIPLSIPYHVYGIMLQDHDEKESKTITEDIKV